LVEDIPFADALVDAHVHFWQPARLPYPWLAAAPSIAAAHVPANLRAEASVVAKQVVFVQSECDRARAFDEVAWAEELAAADPRVAAFVAFAPMDRGAETRDALDRLCRRPLVRGVRHLLQDQPDADAWLRTSFVEGVRAAGDRGLLFELCVRSDQLPAARKLVRACPATRFVLDHAGKPEIRAARIDPWRAHVEDLASCAHVACKVSGLVTEADLTAWRPEQLEPFVDHLVACFGPDRLLFGSDWPVVKLATTYDRWLVTARALVARLPPNARRSVFSDTARRTYGLS
jgi:L-fuconolactonase